MTTVFKLNQPGRTAFNSLLENFIKETAPASTNNGFNPQVNINETKDAYLLEFNVPGRQKEKFNINLDKKLLTVSYQPEEVKADENVKQIRKEFTVTGFSRTFTVDEKIDAENISAKYENGILSVSLPKKEEIKVTPKVIAIS
jgi:HSP20 family protein